MQGQGNAINNTMPATRCLGPGWATTMDTTASDGNAPFVFDSTQRKPGPPAEASRREEAPKANPCQRTEHRFCRPFPRLWLAVASKRRGDNAANPAVAQHSARVRRTHHVSSAAATDSDVMHRPRSKDSAASSCRMCDHVTYVLLARSGAVTSRHDSRARVQDHSQLASTQHQNLQRTLNKPDGQVRWDYGGRCMRGVGVPHHCQGIL